MSSFRGVLLRGCAKLTLLVFACLSLSSCGDGVNPKAGVATTGTDIPRPTPTAFEPSARVVIAPTATRSACAGVRGIDAGRITWLALGDSYTVGEGVSPQESWPIQLAEQLREQGADIPDPTFAAFSGMTTGELHFRLERLAFLRDSYDLVTLQIGANDQFRGSSSSEYGNRFEALLQRALRFASADRRRLIVISIPDYSVTPFAAERDPITIQGEIAAFNEINRSISRRYGVHYVDITPLSREMTAGSPYLANDTLHPSGEMYTLWASSVLTPACQAILSLH